MLNALRHQRFSRKPSGEGCGLVGECSTPYGIRGSAAGLSPVTIGSWYVLNALRHQRFSRLRRVAPSCWAAGAQRLTASEVQQPGGVASPTPTPQVLNALRHQRFSRFGLGLKPFVAAMCSTPYGIRGSAAQCTSSPGRLTSCAQRLTASEVQQHHLSAGGFILQRAQRLTASEVQQIRSIGRSHQPFPCSTPYGIRGSAVGIGWNWYYSALCSTPYGIRGSAGLIVRSPSLPRFGAQRLTASEVQQRKNNAESSTRLLCSTPYGIRGSAGFLLPCKSHSRMCSTPYGIRGSAGSN